MSLNKHINDKVPVSAGGSDQRWRVLAVCLVLAAITFAVFGQTLTHGFINYDDNDYVCGNPVVARGLTRQGIVWAFSSHAANWHPLTWLSHMLDCQLYGLHPGGHHLTNVLLHIATVIALFLLLREMTGAFWRSAFVAAVFAIHPLRVESVAWIAERKDVLSGLFFMLTLGAYVRYARRPWSWGRYGLVLLLFAMGLMCKPMLVTLPLVLLLLDYWPLQRMKPGKLSGLVLEKLPLLALSAASCVATLLAQSEVINSGGSFSLLYRLGNALASCMVYLGQMVWPAGLAVLYPYPHNGLPPWEEVMAGTLLAGLSALAFWQRRKQPWLLIGWLWYLVMLVPVLGIIQVGLQAHADRYTYLPQIGIYVAVTWLVAEWRWLHHGPWRVALGGLMAGVVGVLMACAWKQAGYWKNDQSLWDHTLDCTTNNDEAHYCLGNDFIGTGKVDEAISQYQEALQINPGYADAHDNLGVALMKKGKVDEAISQFRTTLQIKPSHPRARFNLGVALVQEGKVDEAISQYQEALQFNPESAQGFFNLGSALLQKGKVDEAISRMQTGLQIDPDSAQGHFNLGLALLQKGNVDEAISHLQMGLQNDPDNVEMHVKLGNVLMQKGRVDEGIAQLQTALQINPDNADIHVNLGNILMQTGKTDKAIAQFQKALQINPGHAQAHNNLGNAFLQQGKFDEAIAHLQKALQINPGYGKAHNNLGNAFLQKGNLTEAIAHFQQALQFEPTDPGIENNLAWLLATCPKASLRNGRRAVELATQSNALTGGENPLVLHTLAAAYAEAGRFSEAAETAQRAMRLAEARSNTGLAGQLQLELKLYQANKPFHIPAQTH